MVQDWPRLTKIDQDWPRLTKIGQDDCLARWIKMALYDIAKLSNTFVWQDGARWSCKILQDLGRPLFGKMEQDGLVRYC